MQIVNNWLLSSNVVALMKYLTAAGVNTLFGLAAYPLLYWVLHQHLSYLVILVICQAICISFSYINYKLFVFKTKQNYLREFIKFVGFYAIFLAFNLIALPVLVEYAKLNPVIAQTIIAFALMIASYFWHRHISFK